MQRREFLQSTALGAGALLISGNARSADAPAKPLTIHQHETDRFEFRFRPESPRPLRILQLTDTHFGSPKNAATDQRTFEMLPRLVARHQPDFIMHTGDFINNDQGKGVSFEATEFMDSLGVPWSHALGNHDIGAVSTEEYRQRLKNAPFGYFDADRARHYAFRFDVTTSGDQPAWTIFVFDSGHRMPHKHVSPQQLAWLRRQLAADAEREAKQPAVAMIHIPVVEFETIRAAGTFDGIFGERVCFESDTGNTFRTFQESGRVKAIFSGHDHANDYCGRLNGLELVYGRVSGWSGYGDLLRGGRLIELDPATGKYSHRLVFADA